MWALIIDGTVRETTDIDPIGRFHESLEWVTCTEEIKEGWLLSEGVFSVQVIEPISTPVISVTPWQIRKALNQLSLRDAVEAAVASADATTKDAWNYAQEFLETDPLVIALCAALGKSDEERHTLFQLAASL
jgi:hypothetical protein